MCHTSLKTYKTFIFLFCDASKHSPHTPHDSRSRNQRQRRRRDEKRTWGHDIRSYVYDDIVGRTDAISACSGSRWRQGIIVSKSYFPLIRHHIHFHSLLINYLAVFHNTNSLLCYSLVVRKTSTVTLLRILTSRHITSL